MFELTHASLYLSCLVTALFLVLLWQFYGKFQYWKKRNVPYIPPIIPFGITWELFTGKAALGEIYSNVYSEFKKQGHRHGGIYYLYTPMYITVDPEIIKRILITDADKFVDHGFYNSAKDPLSRHLLNIDGGKWRTLRSKLPSSFTSAKMRKMFTIMTKKVDPYMELLDSMVKKSDPINIKTTTARFTIDMTSACLLGIETNTMKFENEELLRHTRGFFDFQWNRYTVTMIVCVSRYLLEKFNFRVMRKDTEHFVMDMFKKIYNHRKAGGLFRDDLTDSLIKLTEMKEEQKDFLGKRVMDPLGLEEFVAVDFGFLSGGFETPSSTQAFALFELAKSPECQTRLRKEINRVLEKYDNELTYDAILEMKYLDNVIDETLRKYPILPFLPRICKENYPIPGTDFTVEKGTFVVIPTLGLHRDPEYYPNPEKFDPDRFNSEHIGKRPHVAYLPFGEGPRICIGKRFGQLQSKLGLVSVVRNYEVTLNEKTTKDLKFVPSELILRKKGDIWINLKKIR